MTQQPTVLMRCERCRAVISNAEAKTLIRHGVPCGVCGGTLTLCGNARHGAEIADRLGPSADGYHRAPSARSPERRLLGVLREADGEPVAKQAIAAAGIEDPANTIFELEQAGHRIERAYADASDGRRRFLGYRLRRGAGRQPGVGGSQPSTLR
jgi:helix-turn-helix protein